MLRFVRSFPMDTLRIVRPLLRTLLPRMLCIVSIQILTSSYRMDMQRMLMLLSSSKSSREGTSDTLIRLSSMCLLRIDRMPSSLRSLLFLVDIARIRMPCLPLLPSSKDSAGMCLLGSRMYLARNARMSCRLSMCSRMGMAGIELLHHLTRSLVDKEYSSLRLASKCRWRRSRMLKMSANRFREDNERIRMMKY